jgi:hypothetical protein
MREPVTTIVSSVRAVLPCASVSIGSSGTVLCAHAGVANSPAINAAAAQPERKPLPAIFMAFPFSPTQSAH